jgi:amino acid adenylation domain-containing protein
VAPLLNGEPSHALSHSQLPIFVGQSLHPGSPLYNMAFAFLLNGAVDVPAFQRAWRRVVAESDVLRTAMLSPEGSGPRAVIAAVPDTVFEDWSTRAPSSERFREWAKDRCSRVLPVSGPLVDSALVKLADDRFGWYLNQHHLVTDASSTVLLFREVAAAYGDEQHGGDPPAPRPRLARYYDTARSLTSYPHPQVRSDAAKHWSARLERRIRRTALYGRSTVSSTTRSERRSLVLDEHVSQRLRESAATPGFLGLTPDISLFTVFATLVAAWIHRVSGSTDVDIDTPVHNRPTRDAKRSLGVFIELFPFAVSVAPDDTFRELGRRCLDETQQLLRGAFPGMSSLSGQSASNVVLNVFFGGFGSFARVPVTSEWVHPGHSDSVHAVRVQVHDYDRTGCFALQFDLNEETFPPPLNRRAVDHFNALLHAFITDPDTRIAAVDILTPDERETILVRFNNTASEPAPSATVSTLFTEQARSTPDAIALREGARQVPFAELQRQVTIAGRQLAAAGVTPGGRVAVLMPRSVDAVVAILAILQSRAAFVPLDPGSPAERIRHVLADAEVAHVVVSGSVTLPADIAGRALRFEDLCNALPATGAPPREQPALEDLAYIIYTSGSLGTPKGVPIEHGGLADYVQWAARQYVRGDRLTFPLFTPLAFDLTITSVFLPLVTGGTLVIYPESRGPVDGAIMDVLRENAVDFLKLTPSHLSLLVSTDLSRTRIRRMVVGGEAFTRSLAARVQSSVPDLEIYNEYGPTEAVVGCSVHRYDAGEDHGATVPIGRPADHVQLYVLNGALRPVPAGAPGELSISRFGLARGYHGREEATRQHFLEHPFRRGDRLYRTGDLVRFNDRGVLEYLGRVDRQVKVSGFRVEPAEIEAALLSHDHVDECLVISSRRRSSAKPDLVVYCSRCGLASTVPDVSIEADGVCSLCRTFESVRERTRQYFRNMSELRDIFRRSPSSRPDGYDCMMLLSGGKDSTYALCQLVDMGLRVYAFTLDNGYISEEAKQNIRRTVAALGVNHEFATTPAMNAIFRDSLRRFSNVCNGCFKTLYTLSMVRAREHGIAVIVTGLSRGQFFETRLSEGLFRSDRGTPDEVDAAILTARKAYHRSDDEVSRALDVSIFGDDAVFDEIQVVDFFRYSDAGLADILSYLERRVPWLRPSDTGRSTNCLINDVGIYVHQRERGYHNYALPYSWDVRLGVKTRDEAVAELQDEIDTARVERILDEIGYRDDFDSGATSTGLTAYYVARREIAATQLRTHLADRLPAWMIPQYFVPLASMPLTPNGKIDVAALPPPEGGAVPAGGYVAPATVAEQRIASIWQEALRVSRAGAETSFFALGGTSLTAMAVMVRICDEFGVDLPLSTIFEAPTVSDLARVVEVAIVEQIAGLSDAEAERLAGGPSPSA